MSEMPSTHGRVRFRPGWGDPQGNPDAIGITLSGTEYVLSLTDALGLANAIILTSVDRKERRMTDEVNAHLRSGYESA